MDCITTDELHGRLLRMAQAFDDICRRHRIPYYMLGGTMLGAVRHGGFIPWDDDMDFGVPRPHFESLRGALQHELPEGMAIKDFTTTPYLHSETIKIVDEGTVITELWKEHLPEAMGLNIDIFPLDQSPDEKSRASRRINVMTRLMGYKCLTLRNRPLHKALAALVVKAVLAPWSRTRLVEHIGRRMRRQQGDYIANHWGAWGRREIIPRAVMGEPRMYRFEDTEFYGVEDSDAYLRHLYDDYMQLPPEGSRHFHLKSVRMR